ncbi:MAG TPA: Gfo/Idh/MocA family oxidoreductase [Bryobacteraceae bacterium]|jgi:predicted dehydrogenase|nr:Gfo/Idh/MocA family oxidoreductase [Bryobacteraceae bacterium]
MKVGIVGTGAISHKHAQAYRNIGWDFLCTNQTEERGRAFASKWGCEFVPTVEDTARRKDVDLLDVCTFPDYRLEAVKLAAENRKHIMVQKPVATNLETARRMIEIAAAAKIQLGVMSQHRFDDSSLFLTKALAAGRLGKILQADAYVKWYRSDEYYSRPIKGSWKTEGGGALINQAIHQVDVLLWLVGPAVEVFGNWQIAAAHKMESEDVVNGLIRYASGATGVVQASTAMWPGYTERIEINGTRGTAILSGDKLTAWDVKDDAGEPAPVAREFASGASDPMAISLEPFERQFLDFGDSIQNGRKPVSAGEDGYRALELVLSVYESCRTGAKVALRG